jgi:hypothetical protein
MAATLRGRTGGSVRKSFKTDLHPPPAAISCKNGNYLRIRGGSRKFKCERQDAICEWSAAVSYDFRMAEPVYGIDDFPDDYSLWRVESIGGVGYNTSVPSDPRITICLTNLTSSFLRARRIRSARELVFRRPRLLVTRGPIWFGVPYRDALKFTFAQLLAKWRRCRRSPQR